jgi:hypothetical protein
MTVNEIKSRYHEIRCGEQKQGAEIMGLYFDKKITLEEREKRIANLKSETILALYGLLDEILNQSN